MIESAESTARGLAAENRRLAMELAETREVLRAIRRGEVDALVSSEADAVYTIQLAALAVDKAETYLESLSLLLRQLCLGGGWEYGEAWAASTDRQRLHRTSAWYGGCSDAIRLRESIVRLLFDEAPPGSLMKTLETGWPQWGYAAELPPGSRAAAITQCGFQTSIAFPVTVAGEVTAVLSLWKKQVQERNDAALAQIAGITAEVGPLIQRKRNEEILRSTVNELQAAVRERTLEVARLSEMRRQSGPADLPSAGAARTAMDLKAAQPAVLLPALLESMEEGVVVVDPHGCVLQFNAAARRILGDDPPGRVSLDLWPDLYGLYHADKVTRLDYDEIPLVKALHGAAVDRMEIFVRNGARPHGCLLQMSARPLGPRGNARLGAVTVFEDVTQRKRNDEDRFRRVLAQRDVLLREVHHRIKNNLAAVSELLRHHTRDHPQFRAVVEQVEPQLRAIATVYGLKAGTDGAVHLGPLITSVSDSTASLHGGQVRAAIADSVRALRLGEEESVPLALVLNELLVNARKHGNQEAIDISASRDGDGVVIEVSNSVAPGASTFD
ncbi:MAG TPA: histidine kinase dimerization/phosphoacceptor domain -containing protein, partial [Burkholderiales bacterium]|nr:histidine kinase dimerization/phosphoacceptor domain -containing protein [Burkholderiales bacterium]